MPVIGEGTYGCVHKPSLKCGDGTQVDYSNKLSKIMLGRDADVEMKEYDTIDAADATNKFHLPRPIKCTPELTTVARTQIRKCKRLNKSDMKRLRLLIMEDGGKDLAAFVKENPSAKQTEIAFIEFQRILHGLYVLLVNRVLHHDLKPQNIVFNISEHRMNFIDFGYMTTFKNIWTMSQTSTNRHTIPHWSFPPEACMLNKSFYDDVLRLKRQEDDMKMKQQPVHQSVADKLWTKYVEVHTNTMLDIIGYDKSVKSRFLLQFTEFINTECIPGNYDKFIVKSIQRIDVYGIGMTLLFMVVHLKPHIDSIFYDDLVELCFSALNYNVYERIHMPDFLKTYEQLLTDSGLLSKHGYTINKHELTLSQPEPVVASEPVVAPGPVVAPEPIVAPASDPCGAKREMNPKTNRCTKRCKSGYERDSEFVCRKVCEPGTERNPKTGRCVKPCKDNEVRNEKFRCTKKRRS